MMVKLDRDQVAAELAALNSLIESLPPNDYLGRLGLEARRDEIRQEFEQLASREDRRAKVALYFGGEPVIGSVGVQAGFGTKAVGSFQDLLSRVLGHQREGNFFRWDRLRIGSAPNCTSQTSYTARLVFCWKSSTTTVNQCSRRL